MATGKHLSRNSPRWDHRANRASTGVGEEDPRAEGVRNDFTEEGEGAGGKGIKPGGPAMLRAKGARSVACWSSPWDSGAPEQRLRGGVERQKHREGRILRLQDKELRFYFGSCGRSGKV